MPPRTLASLAHALGVAHDLEAALVALAEGLAEIDRQARLALLRYDARRQLLRDRLTPADGVIVSHPVETTIDHLPTSVRRQVEAGGQFVDLAERSLEYARLLGLPDFPDGGLLALKGLRFDGVLGAVLCIYEPRRIFGTRVSERFAPAAALFDLGYARFEERGARDEAVRTLEDVTQRVHGEYVQRLATLERELKVVRGTPAADAVRAIQLEHDTAAAQEAARRAQHKAGALEQQVGAAVEKLEQAHVELHRRSEQLRQKTRTLYLLERVLALDAAADDPRQLVDGLLALVGDDMGAQRCSLMLAVPGEQQLYLAAARGIAPNVAEGYRVALGEGVAGRVAQAREPLLVRDVEDARRHPLLKDQYFTTGSFISFPLTYRGELVGVVNLTNRAQRGLYHEEDVERVRLLGLVISLVAQRSRLPERLLVALGVG
jgi:hypothetical protein